MLTSVEFENYRGFERLKVEGLSRVNLITGYNNSGKTSLLEGLHLLGAGGDMAVMTRGNVLRGEVTPNQDGEFFPNISHSFHGHQIDVGARFKLRGSNGIPSVEVEIFLDRDRLVSEFLGRTRDSYWSDDLAVVVFREREGARTPFAVLPILPSGEIHPDRRGMCLDPRRTPTTKSSKPTRYVPLNSLDSSVLREMWDQVLVEGKEGRVYEALRIIAPDLLDIAFLQSVRLTNNGDLAGILVRSGYSNSRLPLGSSGEGMRRLLALGLCLSEAAGGMLLIDEVDTGLHWSVMPDMWKLVIETAIRTDTQVFATTHSLDCIRALARLCEDNPQYSEHISAQKLHRSLDHSVSLDARNLMIAVEQDIEVR